MGWKAVKDHYRIEHIIQVNGGEIHIGSGYIQDILVIVDGVLQPRKEHLRGGNADLARYEREMNEDPDKLKELVEQPDTFDKSIPVYICESGQLVERFCEETGWPNVTHEGILMHENEYFETKEEAILQAVKNARGIIDFHKRGLRETRDQYIAMRADLTEAREQLKKYEKLMET